MSRSVIISVLFTTLFLFSCKSKHEVTKSDFKSNDSTSTEVRVDTIWGTTLVRDTVFIKVKDPQSNNIVITDPCDSLTGLLRDFQVNAGNTTVTSQGGNLSVETKCDSIVEKYTSMASEKKNLLVKIRELEQKIKNTESSKTVSEKTGVVGWFQKLGITLSAALYVSLVWVALFIIFWITGKIDVNL